MEMNYIETTRRNLLKYGSLAGISALAGINAVKTGSLLQNISIYPAETSSTEINYSSKPYNIFMVNENINHINKLINNKRVENIYLYSSISYNNLPDKVRIYNSLENLVLSLGSVIPFDYNTTLLDIRDRKINNAFLYLSDLYADIQNHKAVINEEKLLSSLMILGRYNKNIYIPQVLKSSPLHHNAVNTNNQALPIGNIITL